MTPNFGLLSPAFVASVNTTGPAVSDPLDDFESYSASADLNGLNGGQFGGWDGAYVSHNFAQPALDDFESYANNDPLSGLNGGSGWAAAFVSH